MVSGVRLSDGSPNKEEYRLRCSSLFRWFILSRALQIRACEDYAIACAGRTKDFCCIDAHAWVQTLRWFTDWGIWNFVLTNRESCVILSSEPTRAPVGVTITVAVASSFPRKSISFCLPRKEGGDRMDYVTWKDLLQIAFLVFAIISCFYNKKR